MALQTTTTVFINGKQLPYYEHLTLSQGISDHNTLTLVCRIQDLLPEETNTDMLGVLKEYTGARVSITIAPPEKHHTTFYTQELLFKGIILEIEEDWQDRGRGKLITFTINSPTVLMTHSKKNASYLDRGIDDIANETLTGYDADKLTTDIRPSFYTPLLYTVQDHCSDFEFLKRLAGFYGQWYYYDGLKLIFGTPDTTVTPLQYGVNLKSIKTKIIPTDTAIQFVTTDYLVDDEHEKDSTEVITSSEHLQRDIDQRAKQLFHKKNTQYTDGLYTDENLTNRFEKQVEQHIKAKSLKQVTLHCTSDDLGVKLGGIVQIKDHGRYRVTQITHTNTHDGNYENEFTAIEASTEVYPMMDMHCIAKSESQTAIVKDNNDPKKLGRVKVQFAWQRKTGQTTPWIRVATAHAGADRGMYFIPEIKDEVMVQFEGGNAERPYVTHSLYNGVRSDGGGATPKNDIKAIKTRGGHLIEFNDTKSEETITISDKSGNKILLDVKKSSMTITAPSNLSINADTIDIKATNGLTIKSEEATVAIDAKQDIGMHSAEATTKISGKENVDMRSHNAAVTVKAKTDTNVVGEQKIDIISGNELAMHGKSNSKLTGGKVYVNKG